MKKLFTLMVLLVAIVTGAQAEDYTVQNPATKTYGTGDAAKTFLDVANTTTNATIIEGNVGTIAYSCHYLTQTVKPAWVDNTGGAGGNSSTYTYTNITNYGFLTSSGSQSYTEAKGWVKPRNSRPVFFYVTGVKGIAILAASNTTSKRVSITVAEYNADGTTGEATENAGSSTNPEIIESTAKLDAAKYYKITVKTNTGDSDAEQKLYQIRFIPGAVGPSITDQTIADANYMQGQTTGVAALSVTAQASDANNSLEYQWYSNTTNSTEGGTAIATGTSYTPDVSAKGVTYYYCVVTEKDGDSQVVGNPVASNIAKITVSAAEAPTISISAGGSTEVTAGASITLTAMAAGVPGPDIQWYVSDTNDTSAGTAISGATDATYTFDAVAGTKYYYAVATNTINEVVNNVPSNVVTVTAAARTGYTLNQVVFSNSFDAFITAPAAAVYFTQEEIDAAEEGDAAYGKTTEDIKTPAIPAAIKAYYMEGETAPTVTSVNMSPGATYEVEGNTLTVTSEDGQTSVAYPITLSAVTPYDGTGKRTFDGTETWVKTGNAFSTASSKQGWVFSKNDSDWSRETPGKNRIYFFLAPCETVTLENGGTARSIKVYKNGTLLSTPTSTNSCTIAGDTENNFMIAIVSDQTSGDGAIKSITTPVPTLTLTDAANSANGEAIAAVKGKTVNATVTRSLASDKYYGVFLPFALTAEQIQAAFGDGAEVAAFTGVVKNNGKTFMFGKLDTGEGMEAYKGYLVKAGSSYAGNFTVEGVTIPTQGSAVGDAAYAMVGTLDRYTYTEGSTIYYFTNAGTIKKLTSNGINGLRAFMADNSSASVIINNIESNLNITFGGGSTVTGQAREVFGIDLEDDVVTGIESIENGQLTIDNDAPAYNLAGQKVGKGYKGIVIINGKKVVK